MLEQEGNGAVCPLERSLSLSTVFSAVRGPGDLLQVPEAGPQVLFRGGQEGVWVSPHPSADGLCAEDSTFSQTGQPPLTSQQHFYLLL